MNYPVYVRIGDHDNRLEGIEIYLTGTGRKIIATNKFRRLTMHKFRYKNKDSLLRKLNGKLLFLDVVSVEYQLYYNDTYWSTSTSTSFSLWSDFESNKLPPEPDLYVDSSFIQKLRLKPDDRIFVRGLLEKIIKKMPKNPSKESKNPFKYMSRYHGRRK